MHNLIALSLGLPGTPLHGLNDVEPHAPSTAAPPRRKRGSHHRRIAGAWRRQPQVTRRRRLALRKGRPAPS